MALWSSKIFNEFHQQNGYIHFSRILQQIFITIRDDEDGRRSFMISFKAGMTTKSIPLLSKDDFIFVVIFTIKFTIRGKL